MRSSSAISVLSVIGGALATMPEVSSTMAHVMSSSSVKSQAALAQTSAGYGMVSAASTTSAPAMVHTMVSSAAVTQNTNYVASMAPPSAAAGPMTHTVSSIYHL